MRTELGLAWAGMRHRPGPWWLLALGIALAALMPLAACGLQTVAAVGAVRGAVDAVPEPTRGVLAVTSRDVRGNDLTELGEQVRSGFGAAGLPVPQQALAFRSLAVGGAEVTIGAVDRLAEDVQLTSGRLPAGCAPTACEVLAVQTPGGATAAAVARGAGGLGLQVTGTAELREPRLAGLGLVTAGQPLLLGSDPVAMTGLASLDLYGRNVGWFTPLDGAAVASRGAAGLAQALADTAAEVNLVAGPLNLTWPSAVALAAADRAEASAPRFAVLGAGAGALQLGFCLVVAAGQRRRQQQHAALLVRRGARPGQVLQVATVQPVLAVLAGMGVGTGAGLLLVAGLTQKVLPRPWAVAGSALDSSWPTLLGLGLAAVLLSVALARWPTIPTRSVRLLAGLALLAAAGLAVLALAAPPQNPSAQDPSAQNPSAQDPSGQDLSAPLATAALAALVLAVGLLAALLWSPAVAGVARLGRSRDPLQPVVFLPARRPLLPSITAAFLAAALATALLAGAYSASLQQSARDRAAAVVPLDVRLTPSAQVAVPSQALDLDRLQAVAPAVRVFGVVSSPVTAFAGSSLATALPLTGVDPAALGQVDDFAAVTGSDRPAAEIAGRLRPPVATPPAGPGPTIPAGTRELRVQTRGLDETVELVLWFRTPDGQEQQVPLEQRGAGAVARFPAGPERTVTAVEVIESAYFLVHRQHGVGEGSTDRTLATGTLRMGGVAADGVTLPWSWSGWGSDQAVLTGDAAGLSAAYRVGDTRVVLVPAWTPPGQRRPLPVAVDRATAARAGSRAAFGITVNGVTQPVQVVAVLPRMPGLPRSFVLADREAVSALVDRTAPGTAPVTQVWIRAPGAALAGVRAVIAGSTAAAATVQYRADLAQALADDPVATGFVRLLGAAGVVALLLSLVAAVAGVRADADASAADLHALELDGVPPRRLRRLLRDRARLVLVVGIPLGLVGGVGLAAAAVRLLGTGPDGRAVVPPLRLVLLSAPTALVAGAALVGAVLVSALAAGTALREPRPRPPEEDLR